VEQAPLFVERVALCRVVCVVQSRSYPLRSQLAHGQQLGGLAPADRQLYDSMEAVLRNALLRSIEDDDFADTLEDVQEAN